MLMSGLLLSLGFEEDMLAFCEDQIDYIPN